MNLKNSIAILLLVLISSCAKEDKDLTLYVSGKTVACEASETPCLQIKMNLNDEWTPYSGTISGFTHTADNDFTLKVKPTTKNTEDLMAGDFELLKVIESHKSPIDLGEGSWNVTFLEEKLDIERKPFLTISESKTSIHGSTSCNKFKSSLDAKNGSFSIGDIATTKMVCPDDYTETKFLQLIKKVSTYEILDNVLHLLAEDGSIVIKAEHVNVRQ